MQTLLKQIVDYAKQDGLWNTHDPYGSLMSLWFSLAEYTRYHFDVIVPGYSPSPLMDELSDTYEDEAGVEYWEYFEEVEQEKFVPLSEHISRVVDAMKRKGLAY